MPPVESALSTGLKDAEAIMTVLGDDAKDIQPYVTDVLNVIDPIIELIKDFDYFCTIAQMLLDAWDTIDQLPELLNAFDEIPIVGEIIAALDGIIEVLDDVVDALTEALSAAQDTIDSLRGPLQDVAKGLGEFNSVLTVSGTDLPAAAQDIKLLVYVGELADGIKSIVTGTEIADRLSTYTAALDQIGTQVKDAGDAVSDIVSPIAKPVKDVYDELKKAVDSNPAFKDMVSGIETVANTMHKYARTGEMFIEHLSPVRWVLDKAESVIKHVVNPITNWVMKETGLDSIEKDIGTKLLDELGFSAVGDLLSGSFSSGATKNNQGGLGSKSGGKAKGAFNDLKVLLEQFHCCKSKQATISVALNDLINAITTGKLTSNGGSPDWPILLPSVAISNTPANCQSVPPAVPQSAVAAATLIARQSIPAMGAAVTIDPDAADARKAIDEACTALADNFEALAGVQQPLRQQLYAWHNANDVPAYLCTHIGTLQTTVSAANDLLSDLNEVLQGLTSMIGQEPLQLIADMQAAFDGVLADIQTVTQLSEAVSGQLAPIATGIAAVHPYYVYGVAPYPKTGAAAYSISSSSASGVEADPDAVYDEAKQQVSGNRLFAAYFDSDNGVQSNAWFYDRIRGWAYSALELHNVADAAIGVAQDAEQFDASTQIQGVQANAAKQIPVVLAKIASVQTATRTLYDACQALNQDLTQLGTLFAPLTAHSTLLRDLLGSNLLPMRVQVERILNVADPLAAIVAAIEGPSTEASVEGLLPAQQKAKEFLTSLVTTFQNGTDGQMQPTSGLTMAQSLLPSASSLTAGQSAGDALASALNLPLIIADMQQVQSQLTVLGTRLSAHEQALLDAGTNLAKAVEPIFNYQVTNKQGTQVPMSSCCLEAADDQTARSCLETIMAASPPTIPLVNFPPSSPTAS